MTPGTLLVRFPAHSDDYSISNHRTGPYTCTTFYRVQTRMKVETLPFSLGSWLGVGYNYFLLYEIELRR